MSATLPLSLEALREARARIAPHVRTTPVMELSAPAGSHPRVTLKLEFLQAGGSFKARGACNKMFALDDAALRAGVVTASGGNHGIGVAYAAKRRGVPATVFLPVGAPANTESRLEALGARAVRHGVSWNDAWEKALEFSSQNGAVALHPFEDRDVIAGQGTVGLELIEQVPDADAVIVAVGGGGLIAGVGVALHAIRPSARIIGVEPTGATAMVDSLRAGRLITLDAVNTIAGTLAPRSVGPTTLALAQLHVDSMVLVSDDEMLAAIRALWDECRVLVEPAGAAAFAALHSGRANLEGARSIVVLVCGANMDPRVARAVIGEA